MRKGTTDHDDAEHVYEFDERGHDTPHESSPRQETAIEQGHGGTASESAVESEQRGHDRNHATAPRQRAAVEQGQVGNPNNPSLGVLLKRLVGDAATLFSKEMALARSEFSHALSTAGKGATSLAIGGAVLFAGFLFLLGAAHIGLTRVVEPWLAAVIVGGVTALIGLIMVMTGKKKMQPAAFNMKRTTSSLQRDRELAQGESR